MMPSIPYSIPLGLALLLWLAAEPQAAEYRAATVQAGEATAEVTVGGTVVPYKEVTLSAQVSGQVKEVAGEEGTRWRTDDLLVRIDDSDIQARRRAALGRLREAEAALRDAQVQFQRELFNPTLDNPNRAPGFGVPSMFDQLFTQNAADAMGMNDTGLERYSDLYSQDSRRERARAQWYQARSTLEELDAKVQEAKTTAPFDGVILEQHIEAGDTVQPGQPLLSFAQTRYLRVEAKVPSRLVPDLRRGQFVPVRLDGMDQRVRTRVAQVYPAADSERHTVTVKFDLPQGVPAGPGMYAEVFLPDRDTRQATLPIIARSAVLRRGTLPGVYIINAKGETELRIIRLGEAVEPDRVRVLSGLRTGQRLIINPDTRLTSGQRVEARSAERRRPDDRLQPVRDRFLRDW